MGLVLNVRGETAQQTHITDYLQDGDMATVEWGAVSGAIYRVQSSSGLAGGAAQWVDISPFIVATEGSASVMDNSP